MKKAIMLVAILALVLAPRLSAAREAAASTTEEITAADAKQVEPTMKVIFNGSLLEIGSTDLPTTLIVRAPGGDVTVNVGVGAILGEKKDVVTKLDEWIPGDVLKIFGVKNLNTGVVEASVLVNKTIRMKKDFGLNGWIKSINKEASTIDVDWQGKTYVFHYTGDTRVVVPPKVKANVDDLQVGDRVRGRWIDRRGETPHATIMVVLRRGDDLRMKIRTWVFEGELSEINSATAPTDIRVKVTKTAARPGDKNALIAVGDERILHVKEDTKIVRRFMGKTDLSEYVAGDKLTVVGRLNDDGTIDAKTLKNNSIWLVGTHGIAGEITAIDAAGSKFTLVWGGKTIIVEVTDKTEMKKAGEKIALTDLAVGDKIKGRGTARERTGTVRASVVHVVRNPAELPKKAMIDDALEVK
ncbi:MAG: DUF5666 domain-containing protein [Patescibacteria group bacterium]